MATSAARQIAKEVPQVLPFADERIVAISAVRRACIVTQKVFETMVKADHFTKSDESPVTGSFVLLTRTLVTMIRLY
jgi:3'(2'), 5'-bisphosphate nucleotidase